MRVFLILLALLNVSARKLFINNNLNLNLNLNQAPTLIEENKLETYTFYNESKVNETKVNESKKIYSNVVYILNV